MTVSTAAIRQSQQLVIDVFKSFREELMQSYGVIEHTAKSDGSPVTELDIKIETALKQQLAEHYPEIGFQGEETGSVAGKADATWIVDPIDGTSSFIHGLPYCMNMAGLVVEGKTIACVLYQFATDDLYTAIRGEGAYKNGKRITIKNVELDNSIMFVSSFVYRNLYHLFNAHNIRVFAPLGASGYEFTRLAQGSIQGVTKLHCGAQIHDDVPGVLLVQEAGGEIVSFEHDEYDYKTLRFVAGTPNTMKIVRDSYDEIKKIVESN